MKYTKPNRRIILCADCETSYDEKTGSTKEWLTGYTQVPLKGQELLIKGLEYQRTFSGFFRSLESLKRPIRCYFHNLKFDGSYMLTYFYEKGYKHASVFELMPEVSRSEIKELNETVFNLVKDSLSYGSCSGHLSEILKDLNIKYETIVDRYLKITSDQTDKIINILDRCECSKIVRSDYIKKGKYFYDFKNMPNESYQLSKSSDGLVYNIVFKDKNGNILEFWDSLKIFPMSIGKIGKSFKTEYQKQEMIYTEYMDSSKPLKEYHLEYFKGDIFVLRDALKQGVEMGLDKQTLGSSCMFEFKSTLDIEKDDSALSYIQKMNQNLPEWVHNAMKYALTKDKPSDRIDSIYSEFFPALEAYRFENCFEDIPEVFKGYKTHYDYFKSHYRGGWTFCVKNRKMRRIKNGKTYDVNSLYPSMMATEVFPIGDPVYFEGTPKKEYFNKENKVLFLSFRTGGFHIKKDRFGYSKNPFVQIKDSIFYPQSKHLESSDDFNKFGKYAENLTLAASDLGFNELIRNVLPWTLYFFDDGYKIASCKDEIGKKIFDLACQCQKEKPNDEPKIDFSNLIEYLNSLCSNRIQHLYFKFEPDPVLHMTLKEYEFFLEQYDVQEIEFLGGAVFDGVRGLFNSYIQKWKIMKIEASGKKVLDPTKSLDDPNNVIDCPENYNPALREISKLMLNNLYGKFGTSPDASFKVDYMDENGIIQYKTIIQEYGKDAGFIPIASCVTAYARVFTMKMAQRLTNVDGKGHGFVYADTDSITGDWPEEYDNLIPCDDSAFNHWKREEDWKEGIFYNPKRYIKKIGVNEYIFKWAGVSNKGKCIILCACHDYKDWEAILRHQLDKKPDDPKPLLFQDLIQDQQLFLLASQPSKKWISIINNEKWDLPKDRRILRNMITDLFKEHELTHHIENRFTFMDFKKGFTAPIKTSTSLVKGGMRIMDDWFKILN